MIVEPVAANMGVVRADAAIPERTRRASANATARLLICDEVITGFRLRYGSIAEEMGVAPDLIMLGKIIGGGMPIGAVAGRADLMDLLAPAGPGLPGGNAFGKSDLGARRTGDAATARRSREFMRSWKNPARALAKGLVDALRTAGEKGCVNRVGSLVTMFLGRDSITDADEARRCRHRKVRDVFPSDAGARHLSATVAV